jgi:hypothetical protein
MEETMTINGWSETTEEARARWERKHSETKGHVTKALEEIRQLRRALVVALWRKRIVDFADSILTNPKKAAAVILSIYGFYFVALAILWMVIP